MTSASWSEQQESTQLMPGWLTQEVDSTYYISHGQEWSSDLASTLSPQPHWHAVSKNLEQRLREEGRHTCQAALVWGLETELLHSTLDTCSSEPQADALILIHKDLNEDPKLSF